MRYYETLFILSPELAEEDTTVTVDKYTGILSERGANIVKVDHWGRRRLAYVVKKFNKGYFVLLDYGATPEAVAEMERNFKIDENIIRYLTVKKSDEFDAEAVAAAQAAAQAESQPETPAEGQPEVQGEVEPSAEAKTEVPAEAQAEAEPPAEEEVSEPQAENADEVFPEVAPDSAEPADTKNSGDSSDDDQDSQESKEVK